MMNTDLPSTLSGNSSHFLHLSSNTSDFITALSFVVVMCFTIFGSLLIFLAVFRNTSSRLVLTTHIHVVSLAFGNLLMAVSVLPVRIVSFLNKPAWVEQKHLCEVYSVMFVFCCTLTVFSLATMSIDRYFCIPRSDNYTKLITPCKSFAFIVFLWVLALILSLAPSELGKEMSKPLWDCKLNRIYSRPAVYCFVTIEVLLPVIFMLVLHCRVTKASNNHFRSVDITGKVKNLDYSDAPTLSQESAWAQVVIKIIFSFIVFWVPRCIFLLVDNTHHNPIHEAADGITEILTYCFGASLAIILGNSSADYKYEMMLVICPFMWYQRREHRRKYQVGQPNRVMPAITPSMLYRKSSTSSSRPLYPL